MFLLSGFIIGLLGSFHCVGMCGPIALSLPVHQFNPFKKNLAIALYNLGRLLTYSLFGLLSGMLGQSLVFFGWQRGISIAAGVFILLFMVLPGRKILHKFSFGFVSRFITDMKIRLQKLFSRSGLRFIFGIGILNGFLPCGLIYIALAGAVATQNIFHGILFMLMFGLGTIPMMYVINRAGQFATLKLRAGIRKAMPYFISFMAVLLILRGLNLGIPYVSPTYDAKDKTVNCCTNKICKK